MPKYKKGCVICVTFQNQLLPFAPLIKAVNFAIDSYVICAIYFLST